MQQPLEALLVLRMRVLEDLVCPKSKRTDSAPTTISSGSLEVRIYVNLCISRGQYLQALSPLCAHNSKVNITTLASKSRPSTEGVVGEYTQVEPFWPGSCFRISLPVAVV